MGPQDPNQNNNPTPQQPNPVFQPPASPAPSTSPQQPQFAPPQQYTPPSQPQQMYNAPQPSGGGTNKVLIIILIVIGVIVILGAIGFGITKLSKKDDTSTKVTGVGKEVTTNKQAKMGDTVDINGLSVTTTPFEKRTKLSEFSTAGAGKTFYVTYVTIKNGSKNKVDILPSDFKLQTTTAQEFSGVDDYDSSKKLANSALLPGGATEGYVVFEIPTDTDKTMTLSRTIYPEDVSKDVVKFTITYPTK
jgi:cell division protein FtsL